MGQLMDQVLKYKQELHLQLQIIYVTVITVMEFMLLTLIMLLSRITQLMTMVDPLHLLQE